MRLCLYQGLCKNTATPHLYTIVLHFSLAGNESEQHLAETDKNLLSCVVQRS